MPFELDGFLPYRLSVAATQISRRFAALYGAEAGLSIPEWRVLAHLDRSGAVSVRDIHLRVHLDKSVVSRAATRLEEKGLITREVLGSDRRLRNYAITARGEALFRLAFTEVEARAEEVLAAMSARDRAALERGVAALDQAIAQVTQPESGHGAQFPRPGRVDQSG